MKKITLGQNNRSGKIFNLTFTIFFIVGLITFISLCFASAKIRGSYKDKIFTTGTVIRAYSGDDDNSPCTWVKYEIDGVEYESSMSYYNSRYKAGKKIEIYYDKDDPTKIGTKSGDALIIVFIVMSAIIMLIGLTPTFIKIRKHAFKVNLKEKGKSVMCSIGEVYLNTSLHVNNKSPYRIKVYYLDDVTHEYVEFVSENLWFDPTPILQEKQIDKIEVTYNPDKPKIYLMDLKDIF